MTIYIPQYYDWWFDSAIEFLGHLLETVADVRVEWDDGIRFEELNDKKIKALVEEIERLIPYKLKYQKTNNDGQREIKNRAYLPTMHKGKYVNFLGKSNKEKYDILKFLLTFSKKTGTDVCDICSRNYEDDSGISQVSQIIYPISPGSLSSQCGIRKIQANYNCCPQCAVLGCLEWLDDIPFLSNHRNLTHYYLFPRIEQLEQLHRVKHLIRSNLNLKSYSNVFSLTDEYPLDEYSLLLLLFENMIRNIRQVRRLEDILSKDWIVLKIKGTEATYQTSYTYLNEITIPNIESLEHIFSKIKEPYSGFVDKTFSAEIKDGVSKEIKKALTEENKYFMSQGLLLDDFHTFSKAFQIRQNCGIAIPKDSKEIFDRLIDLWRCEQ
ncbi:MAG: hypothetical protein IBX72_07760 [Nitrospirae bacterium]|nr:hypothetical protein [Nitrospirota bacterium]